MRIIVVDDHSMVAESLARVLDSQDGWDVVGVAGDGAAALRLAEKTRPDLAIVDILLGDDDGFEIGGRIADVCPNADVLYISGYVNPDFVARALDQDAAGYVTKNGSIYDFVAAVRSIEEGERAYSTLPRQMAAAMRRHVAPGDSSGEQSMSHREREVFRRLAAGESLSSTSKAMDIDTQTVRTLWKRAREKLGLSSFPRRLMRRK